MTASLSRATQPTRKPFAGQLKVCLAESVLTFPLVEQAKRSLGFDHAFIHLEIIYVKLLGKSNQKSERKALRGFTMRICR